MTPVSSSMPLSPCFADLEDLADWAALEAEINELRCEESFDECMNLMEGAADRENLPSSPAPTSNRVAAFAGSQFPAVKKMRPERPVFEELPSPKKGKADGAFPDSPSSRTSAPSLISPAKLPTTLRLKGVQPIYRDTQGKGGEPPLDIWVLNRSFLMQASKAYMIEYVRTSEKGERADSPRKALYSGRAKQYFHQSVTADGILEMGKKQLPRS